MRLLNLTAFIAITLSPALGLAGESRVVVTLQTEATVGTPEVSLGQVAALAAPEPEMAAQLAAVSLSSAPLPGASRTIGAGYITLRLRRFGFSPDEVEVRGEAVTVHRAGALSAAVPAGHAHPATPAGDVAAPPLIRRGQLVEAEVRCGAVAVRAAGIACRDAGPGEMVDLRLDQGSRRLTGRVTGPGQVLLIIAERVP